MFTITTTETHIAEQKLECNKMYQFSNYKNGEVTINTYRFPNAMLTDVNDIISASNRESGEILTATIESEEERQAILALSE